MWKLIPLRGAISSGLSEPLDEKAIQRNASRLFHGRLEFVMRGNAAPVTLEVQAQALEESLITHLLPQSVNELRAFHVAVVAEHLVVRRVVQRVTAIAPFDHLGQIGDERFQLLRSSRVSHNIVT